MASVSRRSRNGQGMLWVWLAVLTLMMGCNGGSMEIQIALAVTDPAAPVRMMDEMPVYPMGQDLSMAVTISNPSSQTISMDDPRVSTALFLKLRRDAPEDPLFMIHPRVMDATGEITRPTPATLQLQPDQSVTDTFDLHRVIVDKCFLPGVYELYIEFRDVKSPLFTFGVEYRPASVPLLLELALDEQTNPWVRDEAVVWLKKLPQAPDIKLPAADETEEVRAQRVSENKANAARFMDYWRYSRDGKETQEFFEQFRLNPVGK